MKRTTVLISAALTAFVLVIIGGIVALVAQNSPNTATSEDTTGQTTQPQQVTVQTTTQLPQQSTVQTTTQLPQQSTVQTTTQLPQQVTAQLPQQPTAQLPQQVMEQATVQATIQATPISGDTSPQTATDRIHPDQATAIALGVVPNTAQPIGVPELVNFEGTVAYEVIFDQGMVYVDATAGDILYNGVVVQATQAATQAPQAATQAPQATQATQAAPQAPQAATQAPQAAPQAPFVQSTSSDTNSVNPSQYDDDEHEQYEHDDDDHDEHEQYEHDDDDHDEHEQYEHDDDDHDDHEQYEHDDDDHDDHDDHDDD